MASSRLYMAFIAGFSLLHMMHYALAQDAQVVTEPLVNLPLGSRGLLSCQFSIDPYAVFWSKHVASSSSSKLVLIDGQGQRSGDGYSSGMYNITDDFSLVINEVQIDNEDVYFCEVSDQDTSEVIRGQTNLTVYGPPAGRPFIEECAPDTNPCKLATNDSAMNVSCTITGYYPTFDLYFKRKSSSERVTTAAMIERTNPDGTKDQTVTIEAETGGSPYQCFASGIGATAEVPESFSAEVFLSAATADKNIVTTTTVLPPVTDDDERTGAGVVAIIVIFVLILIVAVVVILCCYAKKKKKDSYNRFRNSFRRSFRRNRSTDKSEAALKNLNDKNQHQDVEAGHSESAPFITTVNVVVPPPKPARVRKDTVTELVLALTGRHAKRLINTAMGKIGSVEQVVVENNKVLFDTSQMLIDFMYKHALNEDMLQEKVREAAKDVGRTDIGQEGGPEQDIRVTDDEIRELTEHMSPTMAEQLLEKIGVAPSPDDSDSDPYQRLRYWRDESSNQLPAYAQWDTLFPINNPFGSIALPTDVDLELLNKYTPFPTYCDKLMAGTDMKHKHGKGQKRTKDLQLMDIKAWRDGLKDVDQCQKARNILLQNLRKMEIQSLLPQRKGPHLHKAEIIDVARNILMRDILPVAQVMGIDELTLASYRKAFHPSHLDKGTIGAIFKLLDQTDSADDEREDFCAVLVRCGCFSVAKTFLYSYEISFGELCRISDDLLAKAPPSNPDVKAKGNKGEVKDSGSVDGVSGNDARPEKAYRNTVLQLTDEEVSKFGKSSLRLLEYWQRKIRPVPFHFRASIADGFLGDADRLERAHPIFKGAFAKWELNSDFVENIVNRLDGAGLMNLLEIVEGGEMPGDRASKRDNGSAQLCKWIEQRWKNRKNMGERELASRKFRDFDDKLLEKGFHELAIEIMTVEQQLWQTSSN